MVSLRHRVILQLILEVDIGIQVQCTQGPDHNRLIDIDLLTISWDIEGQVTIQEVDKRSIPHT